MENKLAATKTFLYQVVYANAPTTSLHFFLQSTDAYQGVATGHGLEWPAEIVGGSGPYAISWDWGDGSTDILSQSTPGNFSLQHTYQKLGKYTVKIKSVDAQKETAYLQVVAIVNGGAPVARVSYTSRPHQNAEIMPFLTPLYLALTGLVIGFWIGEWYMKNIRKRISEGKES